jgi:hypothetical protein
MDRRLPISPIPNNLRKNLDSLKDPYSAEGYQGTKATDKDRTKDRTYHTRRDDDTVGSIKIDLKDNDNVIPYYFENVIKPTIVKEGNLIDVPLIYGGSEIWKTVQKDGYYRDKESKIQVPLIMFKRSTVTKRRDIGNKLDGNQAHLFQTFEKKYTTKNQYDNFDILNNRSPAKEYHAVVVPDYVTLTYDCIIWTEYVENMNRLVEAINFASDSYWGDPNRWKFKATIDSFQNQTEVTVGGNRIVRTTFTLTLNGYLIPDVYNKALANKTKFSSVTNIKFTDEQFILQNAQSQPQPSVSTFTTTGPGALSGGGTTISAFPFTGNAVINGSLTVSGSFVDFTGVTAISGSIFSGSFVGDGSGITGVTAEWDGSHLGDASITGSLTVTGGVSGSFEGDGSQITGVISSSYATTSSYAFYAVSASHEIIKEVSSSYADTASFAQSGNGIFSGSFSGSYVGDGNGLTNIPATGIVGLNLSQIASGSATASISPNKGFEINTDTKITGSLTVSGSNHTITGSLSIHSIGTPGLRITSNNDSFEEVKIYDGKITIEDSGQDLATLSSNNTANRLGVLELSNWTTATNGVYLNGYHSGNYANWIGGALIVGRAYTPSSFQHHVALDVTGSAVITGSLTVTDGISGSFSGSFVGDGSQLTGIVSSSYALTASYVETAQTASYVLNAVSSSYASTSSYAFYAVSASHEIIKEVHLQATQTQPHLHKAEMEYSQVHSQEVM